MGLWSGSGLCPFQAPAGPHGPGSLRTHRCLATCAGQGCPGRLSRDALCLTLPAPASDGRGTNVPQRPKRGHPPPPPHQGLCSALGSPPAARHSWTNFCSSTRAVTIKYYKLAGRGGVNNKQFASHSTAAGSPRSGGAARSSVWGGPLRVQGQRVLTHEEEGPGSITGPCTNAPPRDLSKLHPEHHPPGSQVST